MPDEPGVNGDLAMQWLVFNVLGFQAVWWACVIGAGKGWPWAGPVAAALSAAAHLHFSPTRRRDVRLLASALVVGLILDGSLGASGLLTYAAAGEHRLIAPPWILALWAGFALTLTHSMAALASRPWAAAALGVLGGPLAYASAASVAGAVRFDHGMVEGLLAIAIGWGVAIPLLYGIDKHLAKNEREAIA
ncbi:MAG: DUF2878 domain-containing protein [Lysobacteraceae bacterium]